MGSPVPYLETLETKYSSNMARIFLALVFLIVHQINAQSQIEFFVNCLPQEECSTLGTLAENFKRCGGTEEAPKYMCPEEKCNCMVIHECEELHQLVNEHKFEELRTQHKLCGFERKSPKYCCPFPV